MPIVDNYYYFSYVSSISNSLPLILIHGAGGSSLSWPPEIRRLAGYNIYAIDLPGHGKSLSHGEQTIEAYVGHVLVWLQKLTLNRVFVIGHSMGGAIAISLAAAAPTMVAGLGLIGIGKPLKVPKDILENLSNPAMILTAMNKIIRLSISPKADQKFVKQITRRLSETRTSVLLGDYLACVRFDVSESQEKIEQPVIVITGGQDRMVPLRYVQLLANNFFDAEIAVIPEAGHLPMLEKPTEVADRLSKFLEQHNFKT
jgi:pimeloyl-ACP methyl ester carboxylesterase